MKRKISLALGGGGSKGLAHIGVIKAITELNLEISQIAGTSVGALIGGIYATNPNYKELEKIVEDISYLELFKILMDFPVKDALVKGKKMEDFLDKICGSKKIEELPIKFRAVCADIVSGEKYVFDKGKLSTAIRASCAIPGIFSPVKYEERVLIDGGVISPVPVLELEKRKNEKIIAVGLYDKFFPKKYKDMANAGVFVVAYGSMQLMVKKLAENELEKADVKILPPVEDINVLDFVKAKKFITLGYETAIKALKDF